MPKGDELVDFRLKYPAQYPCEDGYYVRSEALDDNWLYSHGVVYAYEKAVYSSEQSFNYCSDFLLPAQNLFIEIWGNIDVAYAERKARKIAFYKKIGYRLLSIEGSQISNLDGILSEAVICGGRWRKRRRGIIEWKKQSAATAAYREGIEMKHVSMWRRVVAAVSAVCLAVSMISLVPSSAMAEQDIAIDAGETAITTHGKEIVRLTYTMPKSGSFHFEVTPTSVVDNVTGKDVLSESLVMTGYLSANYRKYQSENIFFGRGTWTSSEYNFKPGTKVALEFSPQFARYDVTASIKVVTKTYKHFEKEPNDSKKTATKLTKKVTTDGLCLVGDVDWFSFKAPKAGKYRVSAVRDISGSQGCRAYVYHSKLKSLGVLYLGPGEGWKRTEALKLKKGETIYVKVENSSIYAPSMGYHVKIS